MFKGGSVERQISPPLWGRIALLVSLLLVVLPHLLRMPVLLSMFALAIIVWRIFQEIRGWALPHRLLRILLTLLGSALVLSSYHTVVGREPGVALLTLMLSLKLIEIRTLRDAMVTIFIGYFLVASAFLFSQSILIGVYLVGVVLLLTTGLIVLNHPSADLKSIKSHMKLAATMLLQGVPLMLLLFILFPRLDSPLWSMPRESSSAKTGLSDSMTMGNITDLVDSEEIAFRVRFDGEIPNASKLYWRTMVLWQTDGKRWDRLQLTPEQLQPGSSLPLEGSGAIIYDVTLESHQQKWLPALDRPAQRPDGVEGRQFFSADFQLSLEKPLKKLAQYRLRSLINYRDEPLDGWAWEAGLQLPDERNQRSVELAQQWRSEGLSESAVVNRALSYFRDEPFWYSRRPPQLGGDPVDEFLFKSQRGFCEHYAASFVTLMRAAQIPARVVIGYQGGEVNPIGPLGEYLIVRQSDAHAWAEVWLDEQGWIRIDPTAVIPPSRVEAVDDSLRFKSTAALPISSGQIAWLVEGWRTLRNSWDAANNAWNYWVVGFNSERQRDLFERLGLGRMNWQQLGLMLTGLIALLLTGVALLLLYRRRRIDPVVALYRRFCRRFSKLGIHYRESETPDQFASRVIAKRADLEQSLQPIIEIYYRLRYQPSSPPELYAEFRRQIRAFRLGI